MRDTPYARELKTAMDSQGQAIERILVKDLGQEEIRFSWWKGGKMMMRPLDLPEEELQQLLANAITGGVFSEEFLRTLQGVLNGHLGEE